MPQEECINLAAEQSVVNKVHKAHVFAVVNLVTWPLHAFVRYMDCHNCGKIGHVEWACRKERAWTKAQRLKIKETL